MGLARHLTLASDRDISLAIGYVFGQWAASTYVERSKPEGCWHGALISDRQDKE